MKQPQLFRSPAFWCTVAGIALLIGAVLAWWFAVYLSPRRVFWGMLDRSLSTTAVQQKTVQQAGQNGLFQVTELQFGQQNAVHIATTIGRKNSTVTTENIGTPNADYIRYTGIQTAQKNKNGQNYDFSGFLNEWAKAPKNHAPLFQQVRIGVGNGSLIPFGYLPQNERQEFIQNARGSDAFLTDFSHVKKIHKHGQLRYVYKVKIEPVAYVGIEKLFAQDIGSTLLNKIDPNEYQGQPPIKIILSVNARSHRVVKITYPGKLAHTETYGHYNIPPHIKIPHATTTTQKLKNRLAKLQ